MDCRLYITAVCLSLVNYRYLSEVGSLVMGNGFLMRFKPTMLRLPGTAEAPRF